MGRRGIQEHPCRVKAVCSCLAVAKPSRGSERFLMLRAAWDRMAVTSYALSEPRAGAPQRGAVTRMLEDERWLALVLLLPTIRL
jgi:hypothetical protein